MSCSDAKKPLKKEKVEEDDDEEFLGSLLKKKKKPTSNATTPKAAQLKKPQQSKVKKEENFDDDFKQPILNKPLTKVKEEQSKDTSAKNTSPKIDSKKKKNVKVEIKSVGKSAEQNGNKRVKKVYDLPGQKRDPPEERDPLRIFYESLYDQLPHSEMAAFWMMDCGLLSREEAKKVHEKKLKRSQQQKLGSPMKKIINVKKSDGSVTVKKKVISSSPSPAPKKKTLEAKGSSKPAKKRKIDEDSDNESDDDFELSNRKSKKQKKC